MTNEDKLRIYAAYLPYGLKGNLLPQTHEVEMTGIYLDDYNMHEIYIKPSGCYVMSRFKPIIYPLDFLTKEIEHEGERFVPIHKLRKYCIEVMGAKDYDTDIGIDKLIKGWEVQYWPKLFIDILLKWHFNVFNLPEDQFINKTNLKS
ncbi:hypothetical protein EG359_17345 [Chryseobacterium joostei]|uniref:Uncharacterized protein n=1 Tax=Chryseobacterium joostei TaxID=112234 RepID=A0A1N7IB10_9FLAO|nr:hypothetical protein [Chryseobacterium joostei]AZB01269.1 hypothetical protein EG359_17345 [Chryseobacterium joostei]SIS34255.1 hypothetical protein SAMN05421768_103668 [Chryseobacterium joostei]